MSQSNNGSPPMNASGRRVPSAPNRSGPQERPAGAQRAAAGQQGRVPPQNQRFPQQQTPPRGYPPHSGSAQRAPPPGQGPVPRSPQSGQRPSVTGQQRARPATHSPNRPTHPRQAHSNIPISAFQPPPTARRMDNNPPPPPPPGPPPPGPPQRPQEVHRSKQSGHGGQRSNPAYFGEVEEREVEPFYDENNPIIQTSTKSTDSEDESSSRNTGNGSGAMIDFMADPVSEMTVSRRIALVLKEWSCYYPGAQREKAVAEEGVGEHAQSAREAFSKFSISRPGAVGAYPFTISKVENPSLAKAWAYFEHFVLPRYVVNPENDGLDSAEPGEKKLPTKLYNPFRTPHRQLGDWGLGVGLYFETLRNLCALTFLAGLMSLPNIIYYSGDEYSNSQDGLRFELKGTAVCTDTKWVPCETCTLSDFPDGRVGEGTNEQTGEKLIFALRNLCEGATFTESMITLGVLGLITVGLMIMNMTIKRMEVQFDEDEQTAQDYSIVITNPPPDAYDPEEWRAFFYENFRGAHVTTCTVGVDNDLLVSSLVERREKMKMIEMKVEPGTSLDTLTLAHLAAQIEKKRKFFGHLMAAFVSDIPELVARVVVLNSRVQGLAQEETSVSNVFLTFETETGQRFVLDSLLNGDYSHNSKLLFRGEHKLKVKEPDEPNTIRWQDLNEKKKDRAKQQFFTSLATFLAIGFVALVIRIANDRSVMVSAFLIAIFNVLFPELAKFMTDFERHHSEGTKQRSLYFKIALFRWINTAVVISIISPFTKTLSDEKGLIGQIYALFFAEIITTNAIQLSDIGGHIQRHLLAPRAKSQDAMNLKMQGAEVQLAERYTNMTKIFFLALWYTSIFPGALFLCSLALFINYYTDRYSMMRTWKRIPHLGPRISKFSRTYFFPLAAAAMALLSSYYFSAFPFDNLCENDDQEIGDSKSGSYFVDIKGEDNTTATVDPTSSPFDFCKQDFFRFYKNESLWDKFPFHPSNQPDGREWMTNEQEDSTQVWAWVGVGFLGATLLVFVLGAVRSCCCKPVYRPRGDEQGVNFSDVDTISTYLPQVKSPIFAYPLVACDIDDLDEDLFDWADPERPYTYYDLTKDANYLVESTDVTQKMIFSQIKHWPPPKFAKSD